MSLNITVNNNSDMPNRYVRKLKYHLYSLAEKFNHIIYAIINIKQEGQGNPMYELSLQIGVSGPDVIIKNKSVNLDELLKKSYRDAFRYCRKAKPQH